MEAIREINGHVYLVDGSKTLGYIRQGQQTPEYFPHPLRFDRRGRKFVRESIRLFGVVPADGRVAVQGSRGNIYYVDRRAGTCTCPGYTFRGTCKHIQNV